MAFLNLNCVFSASSIKAAYAIGRQSVPKLNLRPKHFTTLCRESSKKTLTQLPSVTRTTRKWISYCLSGAAVSIGGFMVYKHINNTSIARCESSELQSRVLPSAARVDEDEAQFPWSEFFKLLVPDVWLLLGAVLSSLAAAVLNIQIPLLLGDVVEIVSKYSKETSESFLADITIPALQLMKVYCFQAVLTFTYIAILSIVGERVALRLRSQLFESIITQDIAFFDKHQSGELVNRLSADVQDFKSSFKLCVSQGLRCLTQILGCVVSLLYISPKLTLAMICVVPSIIGAGSVLGTRLRVLSKKAQAQVSKASAVANEAISNVRTVRASAMESKEMELFNSELQKAASLNKILGFAIGAFQGISNLALNGIVLGTLFIGGVMVSHSELKTGDLMSFMVANQTVQRSLTQMSLLFGTLVRGVSAGSRVFEFIQLQPGMQVRGGLQLPLEAIHGHVKFVDVEFTYPTRPGQTVLKEFNLDIPPGKVVALVGLSGGGKSTVAALLERFYDVDRGRIELDGHNLNRLDPSWLRGTVLGFINQEPVLFATSIMENIRYAKPDASDEDVMTAAKLANADQFIRQFPQGYETVLGERGVTVSGGQKQRIAIARALIKNPKILILDEATSALDAESERVVQDALEKVIKGRSVLVIAHRLSTIRNADMIAVMVKGDIKEMGRHEELKLRKGYYWDLIKEQEEKSGNQAKPDDASETQRKKEKRFLW